MPRSCATHELPVEPGTAVKSNGLAPGPGLIKSASFSPGLHKSHFDSWPKIRAPRWRTAPNSERRQVGSRTLPAGAVSEWACRGGRTGRSIPHRHTGQGSVSHHCYKEVGFMFVDWLRRLRPVAFVACAALVVGAGAAQADDNDDVSDLKK